MRTFLTLDAKGVLLALLLGLGVLYLGGNEGVFFLLVLFGFLILSAIVTRIGERGKKAIKVYERARGWKNVLANGLMPLVVAGLYYFNQYGNQFVRPEVLVLSYVATVAAITADKFSSEIGVLNGDPLILATLKMGVKGKSGGVSALGLVAGLFGSFVISLSIFAISLPWTFMIPLIFVGFFGNIIDSLLGYFEDQGYGNKFSTNFMCSLSAWVLIMTILVFAKV